MKKWILVFVGLGLLLMGCEKPKPKPELTLDLTKDTYEVLVGEEVEMLFTSNAETVAITSKDESIATVSSGKVTGVKVGTVEIEFKVEEIVKVATVTVKTTITSDDDAVSFREDETYQLAVTILGGTAVFASDNLSVATVSNTGLITGVTPGTAKITVSVLEDASIKKEIQVTIESIPIVESNLLKAKDNTEALTNFTFVISITETKEFVDEEVTFEFGYHFDGSKFMFTGDNDPLYYSIEDSKTYEYKNTENGYTKEEIESTPVEFAPFYVGLEFAQFDYQNGAYLLKYGNESHFDGFLQGLENPKISSIRLTLENDFYKSISFIVTTNDGTFRYVFEFSKINETNVTLPL